MKLDKSQSIFIDNFIEEINKFEIDFMVLTGPAGSGKTEIIKKATDICKEMNIGYQCLAFTGRAASVLRSRGLSNSKTIESWLRGLKLRALHEELQKFEKFVFFIDESSMISNSAIIFEDREPDLDFKLDEIMWTTYRHFPVDKVLFLFVGDQNQLPPIKHDYCPALDIEYLEYRYGLRGKKHELNVIHRQNTDSKITEIAKRFMTTSQDVDIKIPAIESFDESIQFVDDKDVVSIYFDLYFQNKHDVKIITATNKKADYYNFMIKERLSTGETQRYEPFQIPNSYLEPQKGDILQLFENSYINKDYPLYNGQFLEILDIGDVDEVILSKGPNKNDYIPFIYQNLKVATVSENGKKSGESQEIAISVDHMVNSFNLTSKEYEYFDKKGSILQEILDFKAKSNRSIYFDKKYRPVLVKYGYSITGHKAQGGGWGNIIIDFSGFNNEGGHLPPSWIYTAITRTKSNLYIANYPNGE